MQITLDNPSSAPGPANGYYSQVARVELPGGSPVVPLRTGRGGRRPHRTEPRGLRDHRRPAGGARGRPDIVDIRTLTDIADSPPTVPYVPQSLTGAPPTSMTFEVSASSSRRP